MKKLRTRYAVVIIIVVITGLLSRQFSFIPLWVGDFLYAVLVFFLARFLFPLGKLQSIIFISLLFCYLIEISQLYQAPWINNIRRTLFGRLVLGQGFLWSDMLAYTAGILLSAVTDNFIVRKSEKSEGRT